MSIDMIRMDLETSERILAWKWMLSKYSLSEINKEYTLFKLRCFSGSNHSPQSIENLVNGLFVKQFQNQDFRISFANSTVVPLKIESEICRPLYLFRIIKCKNKDKELAINEVRNISYVWEKPIEFCTRYDRLNKTGESVLYTSYEPSTAILETKLEQGDLFFVIYYKRVNEMPLSFCGDFIYYNNLTEEENLKRYSIYTLLLNEFTRTLPDAYQEQIQYYLSYYISQYFFKGENTCGMDYPSVKGLGANNLVFFENQASKYLEFICIKFCMLPQKTNRMGTEIIETKCGFCDDTDFTWYDSKSTFVTEQLSKYPALDGFAYK